MIPVLPRNYPPTHPPTQHWPCVTFPTDVVVSTLTVMGKTYEVCWRRRQSGAKGQQQPV